MKKVLVLLIVVMLAACNQPSSNKTEMNDTAYKVSKNGKSDDTLPMGPIPNTIMTEAYVKNLAVSIYAWGWPMTNVHNRIEAFRKIPYPMYAGPLSVSPVNHYCMLHDYVDPMERAVACPNQDVVYGLSVLDLAQSPVVVQVPDFGDRFWVYQVCDQRTDGFARLGKMYNSKPGFYLVTAQDWSGKVPDGIIAVLRCPTARGVIIPRVFQNDDPEDKQAIQPIINQIAVYPLADFNGKMKVTEWSKLPVVPSDPDEGKGETKWVDPAVFFDILPAIIKEVPPMRGEEAFYMQIQALLNGIAKDQKVKGWAVSAAIEAEKNYVTPLFQFMNVGYPVKYNWTTQRNGAEFGLDYLTRLSCAKSNIFVNKPIETRYFYQDLDSFGTRLSGANKYTVTFAKGELPPVKGFWSLTLYNTEHFFAPNTINRYSLGTKNKTLKTNPDGSLTIYVQNTPPSADKMQNWLPAPKENFSLFVRCYWPEESVLNDTWTPPPVARIK